MEQRGEAIPQVCGGRTTSALIGPHRAAWRTQRLETTEGKAANKIGRFDEGGSWRAWYAAEHAQR